MEINARPQTRTHRALLVEDNQAFERLVRASVTHLGPNWTVRSCPTGASALDALEHAEHAFDLALIDLGLPDMSGVEVIHAARRHSPELPIMVISVVASEESVLAAVRAGARGYVLKGDAAAPIAQAIEQVLAGNYPISPALARYLFKSAGGPGRAGSNGGIKLTRKEAELLKLLARGLTYTEAAKELGVKLSTIQTHVRHLYRKLDAQSKVVAVSRARDNGLL